MPAGEAVLFVDRPDLSARIPPAPLSRPRAERVRRRIALYCLQSLILLCVVCAGRVSSQEKEGTGTIRGVVNAPERDDFIDDMLRARASMRYSAPAEHRAPVEPYKLSEKAVIYLDASAPLSLAVDPPDVHPQLNQRGLIFRPLVLPVLAGTTVDFPNGDDLFHNVFSYSQPKEFDLGRYPKGQMKSVTFDKPGVVNVYCDIHSYMYATILVLSNPHFTVPDESGHYELAGIPPGSYRLHLWYGRKMVETRQIVIKAGETKIENFTP